MIHGLRHLVAIRKQGLRPEFVEVDVDCEYLSPKYSNEFALLVLVAEGDLSADDFRPFVGLHVVIYSPKATKTFNDLLDRIKEHAASLMIFCGDYSTDLGWEWSRKWGDCEIGETRWAEQFDAARTSVCRTKAETEERLRLEAEALAHCPWIPERMLRGAATA